MIKIRSVLHSNLLFGTILFFSFLLTWGCSKNVAPPDVEAPEVVEAIPPADEDTPPAEEGDFTAEGVDPLQTETLGDFVEEGIVEEPIDVVEVIEEPIEEPVEVVEVFEEPVEVVEVFEEPVVEEPVYDEPPMVFDPPPEDAPEAIQEARTLPFEDEQALQDIHFGYDRDALDSQNKTILRANVKWLKSNPNARVEIQGHADERGTNNYNLGLGERRALQTKKFLISQGISESRLYTISYGEEKPFCFDSSEDCWWKNRRAHFTVAD